MEALNLKRSKENLYNNLLKELKRYYAKNKIAEPDRPDGVIYLEELQYIQRLKLNFAGNLFFNLNGKPFMSFLTGLKRIYVSAPFDLDETEINQIPNKDQITDLSINNSSIYKLDLTGFTNLNDLSLTSNSKLTEIKGLDKITHLSALEFYDNKLVDEKTICKFIINNMENNCDCRLDILLYKRITSLIRKEYSKYRSSFREATWIEKISAGLEKHPIIEHTTTATGIFYSQIADILAEIIPRSGVDDLEAIFLIYSWIVQNVAYDHLGAKSALKMNSNEVSLNLNGNVQKVRLAFGAIGGTNGAFNAIYGKSVVCEGFAKIMQIFLKVYDYDLKTIELASHCELDRSKRGQKLTRKVIDEGEINHSIIKVFLENQAYYCDPTNELQQDGLVQQTKFMKTYEELSSSWFPKGDIYLGKSEPITEEERESLSKLRMAHNIPYTYEKRAINIMDKFDLHLNPNSESLSVEKSIKIEQTEDLLYLGIINLPVTKLIKSKIEYEYNEILKQQKESSKKVI